MIGFGNFDNSTRKRVLDLLEPGDLRLGQVVIKRVAVVKLGVYHWRRSYWAGRAAAPTFWLLCMGRPYTWPAHFFG